MHRAQRERLCPGARQQAAERQELWPLDLNLGLRHHPSRDSEVEQEDLSSASYHCLGKGDGSRRPQYYPDDNLADTATSHYGNDTSPSPNIILVYEVIPVWGFSLYNYPQYRMKAHPAPNPTIPFYILYLAYPSKSYDQSSRAMPVGPCLQHRATACVCVRPSIGKEMDFPVVASVSCHPS